MRGEGARSERCRSSAAALGRRSRPPLGHPSRSSASRLAAPTPPTAPTAPTTNSAAAPPQALADFSPESPIEILKRIMVGSEGTLGFVSRVTYNTVPDHPHKASAFLVFHDIVDACDATSALKVEM